jgi:hypothetical protein
MCIRDRLNIWALGGARDVEGLCLGGGAGPS